jgi:hypothetical protein
MCNRDERVTRPMAIAPQRVTADSVGALYPVDPQSGGTWVGVNDAGVTIALLNRSGAGQQGGRRSRGEIVPQLLRASTLSRVIQLLCRLDLGAYDRFEVIAIHGRDLLAAANNGLQLRTTRRQLTAPLAVTSSSIDDAEAERLRLPLFDILVARAGDPVGGQSKFHDHAWPECPVFSVRMRRADARTVSRSTIEVRSGGPRFAYEPLSIES